jgi:hypothetical protein
MTRAALWAACIAVFISLSCSPDHGLGPAVQGIRGTVYFQGTWPAGILEVRVVVFKTYPPASFLDLSGYSDAIPLLSDSAAYRVELPPGRYAFVGVVCRESPTWNTECVLGFYHPPGEPEAPKSVEIGSGRFMRGVDVTADFSDSGGGLGSAMSFRGLLSRGRQDG